MAEMDKTLLELDALLEDARKSPAQLPETLAASILRDAVAVQKELQAQPIPSVESKTLWQQFLSAVGGWPSVGGLVAASAAGLWIGFVPPAFLPDPAAQLAPFTNTETALPIENYDLAMLLSEDTQ